MDDQAVTRDVWPRRLSPFHQKDQKIMAGTSAGIPGVTLKENKLLSFAS